ncbi:hemolysin family protein [Bacillus coahuilensis]|uniref:hemolysin family protein n=1 Tax=Bacillus coahuilensis TaxID=408580 RepID=UPI00018512BE|nr:hemolysin family protein [Bacillus coahuilensis]
MGIEIAVLILLIFLNAFFAASEIALISLNDNKVKKQAENGDSKAILLQSLLAEPSRFLATIQIGITLAGFLASAFAAESFAGRLTEWLVAIGVPGTPQLLEVISVIAITLLLSYFTLVLGELVPKRLALQKAEGISRVAVGPLTILSKVSAPFVKLLTFSTNTVVRLFGVDPDDEGENVTEEEIRMMVDVGEEKGTIQEDEKMMINNIFELDNKVVSDIMTHRTNIVSISAQATFTEALRLMNSEKFTRVPIFEENKDNIVGILHVKDLLQCLEHGKNVPFDLKEIAREPLYVPDSKRVDDLFREMQKHNTHMSIVIDEYGGTDGIVTTEDIIEEIVGSITDEYDEPELEEYIEELDDNTFIIVGSTSLDLLEDVLKIQLPVDEYDTLSGFVIGMLGYIPSEEERPAVEYHNTLFTVQEVTERKIVKVKVNQGDRDLVLET